MADSGHQRLAWICRHARGVRVLQAGCGDGTLCAVLASEGFETLGIDVEPGAIEDAEARREALPTLVQARLRFALAELPDVREEARFDTVVLDQVLDRRANPNRLLDHVGRALVSGGSLLLTVQHAAPNGRAEHGYCVRELVELLGASSFRVGAVEVLGESELGVSARPEESALRWVDYAPETREPWLNAEVAALRSTVRAFERRSSAAARESRLMSEELLQTRERLLMAQIELRRVRAERPEVDAAFERQIAALQGDVAEREERVRALGARCAIRDFELEALRREKLATAQEVELIRVRIHREQKARRVVQQKRASVERALESERLRVKRLEARLERLDEQIGNLRAQLLLDKQGVRYRIGDAFVRAAKSPIALLKLPLTLLGLFFEGRQRSKVRAREAAWELRGQRGAGGVRPGSNGTGGGQAERRVDGGGGEGGAAAQREDQLALPAVATDLIPAFSAAPREQIVRPGLKIAAVTDEFSWRAWQYEADLYTCTPVDWRETLEERRPDLLLIESTWGGIERSWHFQVRDLYQRPDQIDEYALPEMVAWCRERDIPTVFYNKEDPPNFEVFIDAAQEFDHVFTSDANCIEDYQRRCRHARVHALPFAAQPRIHHPILHAERAGSVCFAGTWYTHRHFKRQDAAHCVLRPALDFGLEIFDRMHGSGNDNYRWPDEYAQAVRGGVPYAQMLELYKRYKVFMNINSVTDSPTMFSRRVFELLASGTPVISSHSDGIANILGADLVALSDDERTTRAQLEKLLGDDEYRERLALRGQRLVFSQHTYTQRLETILSAIGMKFEPAAQASFAWVCHLEDEQDVLLAWANFNRQRHPAVTLVGIASDKALLEKLARRVGDQTRLHAVRAEDPRAGAALAQVLAETSAEWVAVMRPRDHYGEHYLTDYAHAARYAPTPVIGKADHFEQAGCEAPVTRRGTSQEYRLTDEVGPWTVCVRRDHAQQASSSLGSVESYLEWWRRVGACEQRVYSADRFNYICRGAADEPLRAVCEDVEQEPAKATALQAALA